MNVIAQYKERFASIIFDFSLDERFNSYLYKINIDEELSPGDVVIVEARDSIKLATFQCYRKVTKQNRHIATRSVVQKTNFNVFDKNFNYEY